MGDKMEVIQYLIAGLVLVWLLLAVYRKGYEMGYLEGVTKKFIIGKGSKE